MGEMVTKTISNRVNRSLRDGHFVSYRFFFRLLRFLNKGTVMNSHKHSLLKIDTYIQYISIIIVNLTHHKSPHSSCDVHSVVSVTDSKLACMWEPCQKHGSN